MLTVRYAVSNGMYRTERTLNVVSCAQRTDQGKDFALILTVKWKLDVP